MKILVTGRNGFIAKNVIEFFQDKHGYELMLYSHEESEEILRELCKKCDFIYHLAAVQRSENLEDFYNGNVCFTKKIIHFLEQEENFVPIIFASSTQVKNKSVFSITKLEAEKILSDYSLKNKVPVFIYRLNHIFGKFGKPNFNNVVSTFLYNAANNKPFLINSLNATITLTYIDDLIEDFISCHTIKQNVNKNNLMYPSKKTEIRLIDLLMIIANIQQGCINLNDSIVQHLYETYKYFKNM